MMAVVEHAGEAGVVLRLSETPSPELTRKLLAVAHALNEEYGNDIDCVPAYQTLMVHFRFGSADRGALCRYILELVSSAACLSATSATEPEEREVSLPVYYSPEVAADLNWLAARNGCGIQAIAASHSSTTYYAYANGFAPGFCYLAETPEILSAPRLDTPRIEVPAGSVAIADRQTGVYPAASPGGWRIIGRCPVPLFDAQATPPNRISVGSRVKFEPIDRVRFIALGGQL